MPPAFTARQGAYLAFIHQYTQKRGVALSFEEIGAHFDTTPPSVNNMIKTLCARGLARMAALHVFALPADPFERCGGPRALQRRGRRYHRARRRGD